MRIGELEAEDYGNWLYTYDFDGKYFWQIGSGSIDESWQEIPEYLYLALVKYEKERKKENN